MTIDGGWAYLFLYLAAVGVGVHLKSLWIFLSGKKRYYIEYRG